MPMDYRGMKLEKMGKFLIPTPVGKEDLFLDKNPSPWNFSINYFVDNMDHSDLDSR